jgi:hypothetical protein
VIALVQNLTGKRSEAGGDLIVRGYRGAR